jgi:hypothetical protein
MIVIVMYGTYESYDCNISYSFKINGFVICVRFLAGSRTVLDLVIKVAKFFRQETSEKPSYRIGRL